MSVTFVLFLVGLTFIEPAIIYYIDKNLKKEKF